MLLPFSLFFYAWGEPVYISLMIVSIVANWKLSKFIDESENKFKRKLYLSTAIMLNLCALGFFKYIPFIFVTIQENFNVVLPFYADIKDISLPVGISFYTFQAISYIVDVYYKRYPYEKSIIVLGTYISMFPQLIAGPIVRFDLIKEELHSSRLSYSNIISGAQIFIVGLAAKVLIANSFASTADYVFALNPENISMPLAWIGAISYFFQIYFDFNGYSIMAIGLGKMIGFTMPINFNLPYISKSITEFWRRWHISLSTWFRDYLYIPLGGNKRGNLRTYMNLFIVFALCGIWHGAGWNFLIWGIYHGLFLVTERAFRGMNFKINSIISHAYTSLVVLVGWVIFRCESFLQLKKYLYAMAGGSNPLYPPQEISLVAWGLLFLIACVLSSFKFNFEKIFSFRQFVFPSRIFHIALFVMCVIILVCGTYNPFIYYRF